MAYVKAACLTVYGTRRVTRTIGEASRTDTFARCLLQADSLPENDDLPTMGIIIDGMDDDMIVDTGSRIDVLDSSETYVMGQDLHWHKMGGGAQ